MEVYHRQPLNGDLTIRFHINRFEQGYLIGLDWIEYKDNFDILTILHFDILKILHFDILTI